MTYSKVNFDFKFVIFNNKFFIRFVALTFFTYSQSVGLLWTRDRPVAETST
jgi:hypothetical protein